MKFIHSALVCSSEDNADRFYQDLLGFEIAKKNEENGRYIDTVLALNQVVVTTVKIEEQMKG